MVGVQRMTKRTVYQPNLESFREIATGAASLIPVYRVFPADLETPVTVYIKLMDSIGPSFLLESVEGGEQVGRYSFVGVDSRGMISLSGRDVTFTGETSSGSDGLRERTLMEEEDILDVLKSELGRYRPANVPGMPRFSGGAVGYLGYDIVRFF